MKSGRPRKFSAEDSEGALERIDDTLFYSGEISNKFAVFVTSNIASIGLPNKEVAKHLVLNSEGGDMGAANAVIDWMELSPIATIASGYCMSAAVPIIAAGKKGKRYATPRTRFMLHAGWVEYGRALYIDYMKREVEELEQCEQMYAELMARHTGKYDVSWWKRKCNTDPCWYFSTDEALELGIIDAVIDTPNLLVKKPKRRTAKKKAKR